MKRKNRQASTFLPVLLAATLVTSAHATLTYNKGDLFLGFYSTTASQAYLIDLGTASTFRDATSTMTLNLGDITTDLTNIYGSDWKTSPNLFWGVFGSNFNTVVNSDPTYTLYAGRPETTIGTMATPYTAFTAGTQSGPASKINTMGGYYASSNVTDSTHNSVAAIEDYSTNGSFNYYVTNSGGTVFGYFQSSMGNFGNGTSGTALDLFRMTTANNGNPGSYEGTFTISDSGVVAFNPTAVAVPEPSALTCLALGGTLLLLAARSRSSVSRLS